MRRVTVLLLKICETAVLFLICRLCFAPGWQITAAWTPEVFYFVSSSLYETAPAFCAVILICAFLSLLSLWLDFYEAAAAFSGIHMLVIELACILHGVSSSQMTGTAKALMQWSGLSLVLCLLFALLSRRRRISDL